MTIEPAAQTRRNGCERPLANSEKLKKKSVSLPFARFLPENRLLEAHFYASEACLQAP